MTGRFYRPLAGLGAALALLGAVPVHAQDHYSARINVDYRGLDLATPAGRRTLDARVASAIRGLCGEAVLGTRIEAEALDACRDEARAAVQPQLRTAIARATTVAAN